MEVFRLYKKVISRDKPIEELSLIMYKEKQTISI